MAMEQSHHVNGNLATAHFLSEHSVAYNKTDADYYDTKIAAVKSGEQVWMRRNFESDAGIVLDLWTEGRPAVCIDYSDGIADVYVLNDMPDIDPSWTLSSQHAELAEAVTAAETLIARP